jgi:DNA repair protein RadC
MKTERTLLICDAVSGALREATGDELLDMAREYISRRIRRGASLTSPRATRDYLTLRFGMREHEVFCVIHLDKRNRMIDCQEMFRGTIDGASVHPREIVKEALQRNSAACILVHNHPSGVAEPSQADQLITERVKAALALVDIRVLDHHRRRWASGFDGRTWTYLICGLVHAAPGLSCELSQESSTFLWRCWGSLSLNRTNQICRLQELD